MPAESSDRTGTVSRLARLAADELAAFARLFEERREHEVLRGENRDETNFKQMQRLTSAVQRHLEFVGQSWLHEPGQGGRPEALVHLLAFGDPAAYLAVADRALDQLHEAESAYRSGRVDISGARRRRHRPPWLRWALSGGRARGGVIVLLAFVFYAAILASCGSWYAGKPPSDPPALTKVERPFWRVAGSVLEA